MTLAALYGKMIGWGCAGMTGSAIGLLLGVVIGAVAALGVALWTNSLNPFNVPPVAKGPSTAPEKAEQPPPLDFYKALPSNDDGLPPQDEPQAAPAKAEPRYYLQAGSFRDPAEADNLKATLALLGVEAAIHSGESEAGVMHRVRIGPLTKMDSVNRTRALLEQNQIPTMLVREPAQ